MKTLDTPNKKIVYDNVQAKNKNKNKINDINNVSTPTPVLEKIKIEMTVEQAEELLNRPESNRTIVLPSGQKVCVTESGDPNGTPVIMMSGMSMHSRKYALLLNNYGLKYKVKIIGFDRPNIDGSDPIYFKKKKVKKNTSKKPKTYFRKCSKSSEISSNISDATLTSVSNDQVHEVHLPITTTTTTMENKIENFSEHTIDNVNENHCEPTIVYADINENQEHVQDNVKEDKKEEVKDKDKEKEKEKDKDSKNRSHSHSRHSHDHRSSHSSSHKSGHSSNNKSSRSVSHSRSTHKHRSHSSHYSKSHRSYSRSYSRSRSSSRSRSRSRSPSNSRSRSRSRSQSRSRSRSRSTSRNSHSRSRSSSVVERRKRSHSQTKITNNSSTDPHDSSNKHSSSNSSSNNHKRKSKSHRKHSRTSSHMSDIEEIGNYIIILFLYIIIKKILICITELN